MRGNDIGYLVTLVLAPLVSILFSVAYFIAARSSRKQRSSVAMQLAQLVIFCILTIGSGMFAWAAHWLLWDPIECPGFILETTDSVTSVNRTGDTAVIRRSACEIGLFAGEDAFYYFVFVHPARELNDTGNLVLRFDTDEKGWSSPEKGWSSPPRAEWIGARRLSISFAGTVYVVSQQRSHAGNIAITYHIPRAKYPAVLTLWQRLTAPH